MEDTRLQEIVIWAAVDGRPFSGAWIEMAVPVWSKNIHHLLFGPTGRDGRLVVPIEAIRAEVRRDVDMFPMDYTGEVAWGMPFSVALLSAAAARRAREAMALWSLDSAHPKRRAQLDKFIEQPAALGGSARIDVSVVPEGSATVAVQS